MPRVAEILLGAHNEKLSSEKKGERRYGSRGSTSVDLKKGVWFDHESNIGGGVLDLINRHKGLSREAAITWLEDQGLKPKPNGKGSLGEIEKIYPYRDEAGAVLFEVVRFRPKDFRQRRSERDWSVKGVRQVPYRLPEVLEAIKLGRTIAIVEGEKDADNLWRIGIAATCNAGGANKWKPVLNDHFKGADVVIIPDHDPPTRDKQTGEPLFHPDGQLIIPGRDHARDVARNLSGVAGRLRVLDLAKVWTGIPEKADISDFLKSGVTREMLDLLIADAPDYVKPAEPEPGPQPEPSPQKPSPWINMATWDTDPIPEQDWTVLNRFPRRQAVLFSGEGATGKSTVQLQHCAAHSLARDWLGTMPEPGPSIFIDAEDDEAVLHRRLAAIVRHYGVTFKELIEGGLHLMSLAGQDAVLATASRSGKITPTPLYEQILQACGDIKPVMIGLASSANLYAGNEIDRSQVQQFISLLTRLAIVANGTAALLTHPSLEGIKSETGLSGTTQWHNAVRARSYMRGVKAENGEPADPNLREIVFKKKSVRPARRDRRCPLPGRPVPAAARRRVARSRGAGGQGRGRFSYAAPPFHEGKQERQRQKRQELRPGAVRAGG
jgi:hypothetical protein